MLLAGFDAGQTGTRCRIRRWEGDRWLERSTGHGPGVCHLDAVNGERRFQDALRLSFSAAAQSMGSDSELPNAAVNAAVVGASGIEQGTTLQERATSLMAAALGLPRQQVLATGDERTALHGAFPATSGIVLISGTGMICIGRGESGLEHRCGGWGWLLDGAGSAFDLGHQGLQLSLKMADGRLPDHALRQTLWQHLNCSTSADIKARVVRPDFGSSGFASLAPLVVAAADNGLEEAQRILDHSATALVDAVCSVAAHLSLDNPKVSGQGGALKHQSLLRLKVDAALMQRLPQASWHEASGDACDGALELAKDLALKQR